MIKPKAKVEKLRRPRKHVDSVRALRRHVGLHARGMNFDPLMIH